MRRLLLLLFVFSSILAGAAKWYCAPTGSDAGGGTIADPFYSLNHAWTVVQAGDTIYMRGGTYSYTTQQVMTGKNGTSGNMINVWAYPGETPVIRKGSPYTYNNDYGYGVYFSGNHVHFKGVEICYFTQETAEVWHGLRAYGDTNTFERLNIHNNGSGMILGDGSTGNLILNCDFHHNIDSLSPIPFNNSAGLSTSRNSNSSSYNVVRGCRAYWNGDTGFDAFYNEGFVVWDSCWSFFNGYQPDTFTPTMPDDMGEGAGWKYGETQYSHSGEFKRLVTHCIAYHNKAAGFFINDAAFVSHMFNNIAYQNGWINFCLNVNEAHVVQNNIAYKPGTYNCSVGNNVSRVVDHNTFVSLTVENTDYTVSDADFVSLDSTAIYGERQSNGSLPAMSFLKLTEGSDLIDTGVDVGLTYYDSGPDLGYAEYGVNTDSIAPTITAFTIPVTAASLTVAITAFTATDSTGGVTGYKITESAAAPSASGWSASAPASYTFASQGIKTLYAWAKDAAGNISDYASDSVTITLPVSGNRSVIKHNGKVAKFNNKIITR